jgi:uncharacterized protein YndB with AHSA1/START domain
MSYDVKVEKLIARPAADVFRALQEGRLFMNCSADSASMRLDFRPGGKYYLEFKGHNVVNFGEFLEIIPNKKIVFTWCQDFGEQQKPDTQVTIELFESGAQTRLVVVHTGFKDQANCEGHRKGWTGGLNDLNEELVQGRLRMVRGFEASVDKLFEACKNPATFFGFMGDVSRGTIEFRVGGKYQVPTKNGEIKGEFLNITANEKIEFSWMGGCGGPLKDSRVTLLLRSKEQGSSLEILHSGLTTFDSAMAHRSGWETVTRKLTEILGHSR